MLSLAAKIRARSRQSYTLADGETVLELRPVTMQEVVKLAGAPPAVLAGLVSGGSVDREALKLSIADDPEGALETLAYHDRLTKAVVACGVVNVRVSLEHASGLAEDEITPADLGRDFAPVYNRLLEVSGLSLGRLEEAERFPEVAAHPGAHGGDVRVPAQRVSRAKPRGV